VPAQHEVAREQFKYAGDYFAKDEIKSDRQLQVTKTTDKISFVSGTVKGEFNIKSGNYTRYSNNDDRGFFGFPQPYFWRAPTDNDFGNQMQVQLGIWRTAHVNKELKNVTVGDQTEKGLPIKVEYYLNGIAVPYTIDYLIQNDGAIRVTSSIDMTGRNLPELPRFGMRTELPAGFEQISYYGRGPWENYGDRKTSAFVGLYNSTVDEQFAWNYIRPQESGYKTDVRWFSIKNKDGKGIVVEGLQPICFSALHVATENLDPGLTKKQQHPTDVKLNKNVVLQIDLNQRGVGGDNSWGALPHDQYRLLDKKYSYSYIIRLL